MPIIFLYSWGSPQTKGWSPTGPASVAWTTETTTGRRPWAASMGIDSALSGSQEVPRTYIYIYMSTIIYIYTYVHIYIYIHLLYVYMYVYV